ncbi:hypothetical protein [Zavarzinella formosa]|uniref:hypothetical protein n=1 Tax=Zavarzinella formosa TaxID=360055 RepID=UPI0004966EDB|nr:hypothetical protein [Zavarzinella formosa]
MMIFIVPLHRPIYEKLAKKGSLSEMFRWFWAYARIDEAGWFVPSMAAIVFLLASIEGVMVLTHWRQRSRRHCAVAVAGVGLMACYFLLQALMLPVCRHPMPLGAW